MHACRIFDTVKHRVHDVYIVCNLALTLYGYLWTGFGWWIQFIRLVLFASFLLPGFSQMIFFYYFSPRVIRSVPYGTKPRNVMDIYLPRRRWRKKGVCPVVVYVTGGAWIIGYKGEVPKPVRRVCGRECLLENCVGVDGGYVVMLHVCGAWCSVGCPFCKKAEPAWNSRFLLGL